MNIAYCVECGEELKKQFYQKSRESFNPMCCDVTSCRLYMVYQHGISNPLNARMEAGIRAKVLDESVGLGDI